MTEGLHEERRMIRYALRMSRQAMNDFRSIDYEQTLQKKMSSDLLLQDANGQNWIQYDRGNLLQLDVTRVRASWSVLGVEFCVELGPLLSRHACRINYEVLFSEGAYTCLFTGRPCGPHISRDDKRRLDR